MRIFFNNVVTKCTGKGHFKIQISFPSVPEFDVNDGFRLTEALVFEFGSSLPDNIAVETSNTPLEFKLNDIVVEGVKYTADQLYYFILSSIATAQCRPIVSYTLFPTKGETADKTVTYRGIVKEGDVSGSYAEKRIKLTVRDGLLKDDYELTDADLETIRTTIGDTWTTPNPKADDYIIEIGDLLKYLVENYYAPVAISNLVYKTKFRFQYTDSSINNSDMYLFWRNLLDPRLYNRKPDNTIRAICGLLCSYPTKNLNNNLLILPYFHTGESSYKVTLDKADLLSKPETYINENQYTCVKLNLFPSQLYAETKDPFFYQVIIKESGAPYDSANDKAIEFTLPAYLKYREGYIPNIFIDWSQPVVNVEPHNDCGANGGATSNQVLRLYNNQGVKTAVRALGNTFQFFYNGAWDNQWNIFSYANFFFQKFVKNSFLTHKVKLPGVFNDDRSVKYDLDKDYYLNWFSPETPHRVKSAKYDGINNTAELELIGMVSTPRLATDVMPAEGGTPEYSNLSITIIGEICTKDSTQANTYLLVYSAKTGSLKVYINGTRQAESVDYNLIDGKIVFTKTINNSDVVMADYEVMPN